MALNYIITHDFFFPYYTVSFSVSEGVGMEEQKGFVADCFIHLGCSHSV